MSIRHRTNRVARYLSFALPYVWLIVEQDEEDPTLFRDETEKTYTEEELRQLESEPGSRIIKFVYVDTKSGTTAT